MINVRIKGKGDVRIYRDDAPFMANGNEVIIKTISNGICGSDMHRYGGKLPIVHPEALTGHEVGGVITGFGKLYTGELNTGMNVVVNPVIGCGRCIYCQSGRKDLCDQLDFLGTMGEEIVVPAENVIPISGSFQMKYSGMIEPAAVAVKSVEGLEGRNVLIIGCGSIGLLQQQILRAFGGRTDTCDVSVYACGRSRALKANHVFEYTSEDETVETIRRTLGNDDAVDCVIDNVCSDETIRFASRVVKHGGEIRLLGVNTKAVTIDYNSMLMWQITLVTKHIYSDEHFFKALEYAERGIFQFEEIVTRIFPLEQADQAFAYKEKIPSTKVLLLTEL